MRAAQLAARLRGETDRPEALSDLLRLDELHEEVEAPTLLDQALQQILEAPHARSDLRALALFLRAQRAVQRGQLAEARAAADRLGQVRAWAVIGPFANEGHAGLTAVYPPEQEGYQAGKSYPGKEHDVSWRALPEVGPLGLVDLTGAISPRTDATVYAATSLFSRSDRAAVLHLGTSGASKLWLDGQLVLEDKNVHPSRFDQAAVAVQLKAGENRLLLKIAHGSGRLGFTLRIADARDEPLPEVAASAAPPGSERAGGPARQTVRLRGEQPQPRRAPPEAARFPDALAELQRRAGAMPKDARAQDDLALLSASRHPDDEPERLALHAAERAEEALPGDTELALRLFRLEDRDLNRRRAALERGLARSPDEPLLLEALAGLRLERGDAWKAVALADRAVALGPGRLEAQLVQARALDAVGLSSQAARLRLQAGLDHPLDPRALRARAQALRRLGRSEEAAAVLERLLQLRFDDAESRGELVSLRLDRGDLDGALRLLSDAIALEPGLLGARLRAAELLSQNGQGASADEAFQQTARLAPDDPDLHEAIGRHRLRRGDTPGALESFDRSLALRPQNPQLRELVRTVKPEERYAAPWLVDAAQLARDAGPPPASSEEDAEVLADVSVTKVFPNGLSSRTHQLVLRALTQRGAEQNRGQSVQFAPERQLVRVERARLFKKSGQLLDSRSEGERSLSEPWYGLYYDVRAHVISFPQLEPGDVLELVTRLDDSGSNYFADYFGDFAWLQGTLRKSHVDYVLLGPPGRTFHAQASQLPGLTRTEQKLEDGGTLLRFSAPEVARLSLEPGTPGLSELLGWVHVSTYQTWEDVGRFYWGLVKDQLRVTDEVRRAAAEAVAGVPDDERARIRAVYGYVLSKTRYVGLEFGINSFKPYSVETILNRRFGDCKDKASLMHALLEALGIDSRLVLLRMKRLGALPAQPASLAVFNHAILYVPKYDLFLDGTAEFHGSEELPGDDRGADVLIVEPGGAGSRFLRTPEAVPEQNQDELVVHAQLGRDGAASLEILSRTRGSYAPEARRSYESPDERRTRAEEQLARGSFPGVKVTEVTVGDPHAIESPFEARVVAQAPGFATRRGAALRFSPFGQRQGYVEHLAPLSKRLLPQRLPEANRSRFTAEVELPGGWKAELPEGASGEGPQGRWAVSYTQEANVVRATLALELRGGVLQAADYGAFRTFLGQIDQALARTVIASSASPAQEPR